MTVVKCADDCTCARHRERTEEERQYQAERIKAAHQRRAESTESEQARRVHRRCLDCGRLLVPRNGKLLQHRKPARNGGLTGMDAPWCDGEAFA